MTLLESRGSLASDVDSIGMACARRYRVASSTPGRACQSAEVESFIPRGGTTRKASAYNHLLRRVGARPPDGVPALREALPFASAPIA